MAEKQSMVESSSPESSPELELHASAEPVSRVVFPRKPPDASLKLGMDDAESKQERKEQVCHGP